MRIFLFCSVSTALDEAATALTRMKSEKQTYEAFLRGANQAPSPVTVSASSHSQPQPSYPAAVSSVAVATSIPSAGSKGSMASGGGGGGGRTPGQQKGPPQQQQQQQQQQPSQQNQQSPADSMQTVQRLLTQGVRCVCACMHVRVRVSTCMYIQTCMYLLTRLLTSAAHFVGVSPHCGHAVACPPMSVVLNDMFFWAYFPRRQTKNNVPTKTPIALAVTDAVSLFQYSV